MLFSGFRIRSQERDRATDRTRFDGLRQSITKLAQELQRERDGLERRSAETRTSAAFAQASLENEGDLTISSKVDSLTNEMGRYTARIKALEEQIVFMAGLKDEVHSFAEAIAETSKAKIE